MTAQFLETDASTIYDAVMDEISEGVEEQLYPGDERRIFSEALAMVLMSAYSVMNDAARQRMLKYARGSLLDELGSDANVDRLPPTPARAMFRFTLSAPQNKNIAVPSGTRITPDGEIYFATDVVGIIYAGSTQVEIPATCQTAGEAYNDILTGRISTLVDLIPYVESALNIEATSGGDEGEPYTDEGDERYRQRIRLASSSFSVAGPESAYKYHTLTADASIVDAYIETPTACHINIYPILANGEVPGPEILQKIREALKEDVRPMCDEVEVIAPSQIKYDIEVKYYCTAENEDMAVRLVESPGGAIDNYINLQSGALGKAISPDLLKRLMLLSEEGEIIVERADVIAPQFKSIEKYQVAVCSGKIKVSHEVI